MVISVGLSILSLYFKIKQLFCNNIRQVKSNIIPKGYKEMELSTKPITQDYLIAN